LTKDETLKGLRKSHNYITHTYTDGYQEAAKKLNCRNTPDGNFQKC